MLIIFAILFSTINSEAVIRYVKTNGPTTAANATSATSWATACNDLQAVINISTDADEIWVAAGTYKPNRRADALNTITPNNRFNSFVIGNDVKIYGGFAATGSPTMANRNYATNQTILSGDFNNNDVISGTGSNMTISNNTENAYHVVCMVAPSRSNGIYPRLDGFTIKGGHSEYIPGNIIIINGQDFLNIYYDGGGILHHTSRATIVNCIFTGNAASNGGAMAIYYGSPKVINSLFHKNKGPSSAGGAIYILNSNAELINCTISSNFAEAGGGIGIVSSNPLIKNSIIFGNYNFSGYNDLAIEPTPTNLSQPVITYSLVGGTTSGTGNINPTGLTPASVFVAQNSNYNLLSTASAINAGSNSNYNSTQYGTKDLANNTRISGTTIDMGAYEFQQAAVTGISVTPTSLTIEVGENENIIATILPANATNQFITWTTSNRSVASVGTQQSISVGIVSGASVGTAIITATTQDGGFTAQCTVTVVPQTVPVAEVIIEPQSLSLTVGDFENITANIFPSNATNQNVTWSSNNNNIATVVAGTSPNIGMVSGIAAGSAIITATAEDGGATAQCMVTVTPIAVTGISISPVEMSLQVGNSSNITPTITPSNAANQTVIWTSSNNRVATVTNSPAGNIGVVTGQSAGTAIITATSEDGGFTAQCTVTVVPNTVAVTGISVVPTSLTLPIRDYEEITATIVPTNATNQNITWSSSNSNIASVVTGQFPSVGIVGGVAPGTAIITATTADGGFTAQCTVTVVPNTVAVTGITVVPTTLTLDVGDNSYLIDVVLPSDATNQNVTWTSSNNNIATVAISPEGNFGVVTGQSVGTAIITATTEDGGFTAQCTVTVIPVAVRGITIAPWEMNLQVDNSANINYTFIPSNATNQNVTWTSSNNNIATVAISPAGNFAVVTGQSVGTAYIIATTQEGGFTSRCIVTVSPIQVNGVSLNNTTLSLVEGNQATLVASVTPANATNTNVTWQSSSSSVATVSNGVVTAVAPGNAIITVTTVDRGFTASCSVNVIAQNVPVTGVTLNNSTLGLDVGSDRLLVATMQPANATNRNVTWSSSNSNVASVSNGLVMALSPGTATITVSTVDGGYTAQCVVTVITPTITITGLTISHNTLTMIAGDEFQLTTSPIPTNASNPSVVWSSLNGNIASVNQSGLVTAINQGTTRIFARSVENNSIVVFCDVTVSPNTVPVSRVSISGSDGEFNVGQSHQYTAFVYPQNASNKNVSWTSNNPNVAVINSSGLATFLAPGTAKITVTTQDGGFTNWRNVTVINSVVSVTDFKIEGEKNITLTVNERRVINTIFTPTNASNKTVNWVSSDQNIAVGIGSINENSNSICEIIALNAGNCVITGTTVDGNISDEIAVTVNENQINTTGIQLNKKRSYVFLGDTLYLSYEIFPSNASNKNIRVEIENNTILDFLGKAGGRFISIKGIKKGETKVKVFTEDGSFSDSCIIVVQDKYIYPEKIILSETNVELRRNETKEIFITILPENSSNKSYGVHVNSQGLNVYNNNDKFILERSGKIQSGEIIVTVVVYPDKNNESIVEKCTVNLINDIIRIAPEKISIVPHSFNLILGDEKQLNIECVPNNATPENLKWEVLNNEIASIDQGGKVKSLKAGYTEIIAKTTDASGKEIQDIAYLTVLPKAIVHITDIKLHLETLELFQGESKKIIPIITPSNATNKKVNWFSSNQKVAKIDEDGSVTAISAGTSIITAITKDGNKTATCQVIVHKKVYVEEAINFGISAWSDDLYINIDLRKARIPVESVKIYDLLGVCVYDNSSPKDIISVDLQTGVYIVKIGDFTKKIIVIK